MSARVERTTSEEETIALGDEIGRGLGRRAVVLLVGELGAGKTTIAKGIVQGLGAGAPEDVSSPTFTLIHEFGEGPKVYHVDLYRIERASEVLSLGLDDLLDRDAILLVEWGERFPDLWPPDHIEIHLAWVDDTIREVRIKGLRTV
jgi:tRNA threonylcarbamoyladenosine biosynthesis protein TsaE